MSSGAAGSAGAMLRLIRTGQARSRAELVTLTGASRSTVSARVDQLLASKLVREAGPGDSTGGRPPKLLSFNAEAGCIIAVDLGVTSVDVAITDLATAILASESAVIDMADGPEAILRTINGLADTALVAAGRTAAEVRAIGVGIPGPVEFATGRPVHPPLMPGWHDFDVPTAFERFGVPVYVDNDVNVMATAEIAPGSRENFLVVKVGTGIGCGIVVDGEVYRGSDGCAGDIGHIYVADPRTVVCSCGNENCLEAFAGGAALQRDALELGLSAVTAKDVVEMALRGDRIAHDLVRNAGRRLGGVLAALVNFYNPARIVLTGGITHAGNLLLAGVREVVYLRSLPLAARSLEITVTDQGDLDGRLGAAIMAIEAHFATDRVDSEFIAV